MIRSITTLSTRVAVSLYKAVPRILPSAVPAKFCGQPVSSFSIYSQITDNAKFLAPSSTSIGRYQALDILKTKTPLVDQKRSVTKFSLRKGKRKTVKAVLKRFKRLHWGGWIRTRCGRHKKMFKKSVALKRRLRQHIFVNATQSWLLDKMVNNYWRKPKYYIDDPYEQYHKREEYFATRSKPVKYP